MTRRIASKSGARKVRPPLPCRKSLGALHPGNSLFAQFDHTHKMAPRTYPFFPRAATLLGGTREAFACPQGLRSILFARPTSNVMRGSPRDGLD